MTSLIVRQFVAVVSKHQAHNRGNDAYLEAAKYGLLPFWGILRLKADVVLCSF
jgi:hypothetical protein